MEYVITDLKDNSMDNYLKDIITIKGLDIDKKLEMIKTYMNDVLKEKLELDRMLGTTKSIMIEVDGEKFKLLIDNGISISVYSLEDLGSLIKKVNKDADYTDIIQYLFNLACNESFSEFDIKLVKCLNSNTSNDKLERATNSWLKCAEEEKPRVYKLDKHIVIMGKNYTDEQLVEVMNDTFLNNEDIELRLLAGEWLSEKIFGKPTIKKGTFVAKEDQIIDGYTYLNSSKIDSAECNW